MCIRDSIHTCDQGQVRRHMHRMRGMCEYAPNLFMLTFFIKHTENIMMYNLYGVKSIFKGCTGMGMRFMIIIMLVILFLLL